MIEVYSAGEYDTSTHTIRLTLNRDGYVGHIAFTMGGNCRGSEILECGVDYFDTCDAEDIQNLIENDCNLELHAGDEDWEPWFSLELTKPGSDTDVLQYDDIDVEDLKNLLVGVEIIACESD